MSAGVGLIVVGVLLSGVGLLGRRIKHDPPPASGALLLALGTLTFVAGLTLLAIRMTILQES